MCCNSHVDVIRSWLSSIITPLLSVFCRDYIVYGHCYCRYLACACVGLDAVPGFLTSINFPLFFFKCNFDFLLLEFKKKLTLIYWFIYYWISHCITVLLDSNYFITHINYCHINKKPEHSCYYSTLSDTAAQPVIITKTY